MNRKSLAGLLGAALLAVSSFASAASIVMTDDFSNAKSGWPHSGATSVEDLGFAIYADGDYQLTPVADHVFGYVKAPKQAESGDVSIESDMFLLAGVGSGLAGLACRVTDAQNFYGFAARGDAGLMIFKVIKGEVKSLALGRLRSVLAGSVDTRLTVSCKGDELRLSAKDGDSLVVKDNDLTQGTAGLIILGEKAAGTMATFDNFKLSSLAR